MRIALTFVVFCCASVVRSQSHSLFSFEGLTHKDTAIAYRGFDNSIRVSDYKEGASYRVEAKHGRVSTIEKDGFFRYNNSGYGAYDTLTLFIGNRWQGSMSVAIARIPDPQIRLAGGIPGTLNKAWVLAAPYLMGTLPNCYLRECIRVTRYELTVRCGGQETYFQISGGQVPADALKLISTYKGRIRLYFDNVHYLGVHFCKRSTRFSYELF